VPAHTHPSSRPLRVLSLGAGVQSTTLLLMAVRGELDAVPDCAVFADTGWEPRRVYTHLEWLEREVSGVIPIHRVRRGNIRNDVLASLDGGRYAGPPVFVRMPDGRCGPLRRQCTKEYKIEPITAKIRELIGLKPRQRGPKTVAVEQWLGISADEIARIRLSESPWMEFRYPLIERGMTRLDCLRWLDRHGYPRPPKSACIGCPYHSDAVWRDMRDHDPEAWADAVEFDSLIRSGNLRGVRGEAYLHRSLLPLSEVDLSTPEDHGQGSLFDDGMLAECEGLCGV
jgi:hypothetical protein